MTRMYTPELVAALRDKQRSIEVDGLPVAVRPVPDDVREHVLDPRVLSNARKSASAMDSVPPSWDSLLGVRNRPLKADERLASSDVIFNERLIDVCDHKINLYLWEPANRKAMSPALLFIHGGGFTAGNVLQYRRALEYIAEQSGSLVVFPDYRLAPEAPFPASVDDCVACASFLFDCAFDLDIDPARVVIAGDSAGGSLANACIQRMPQGAFAAAVELYPLVDAGPEDASWSYGLYPAVREQADVARSRVDRLRGSFETLAMMYARSPQDLLDPLVSAMRASDEVLSAFPPTTIISAEYDYLRVQDEAFAKRLSDLGVRVRPIRYAGCDHGFFEWPGVRPQTEDAALVIADVLLSLQSN